ncbi:hypothetical protein ACLKA6_007134 [Drosophila palustris]
MELVAAATRIASGKCEMKMKIKSSQVESDEVESRRVQRTEKTGNQCGTLHNFVASSKLSGQFEALGNLVANLAGVAS